MVWGLAVRTRAVCLAAAGKGLEWFASLGCIALCRGYLSPWNVVDQGEGNEGSLMREFEMMIYPSVPANRYKTINFFLLIVKETVQYVVGHS